MASMDVSSTQTRLQQRKIYSSHDVSRFADPRTHHVPTPRWGVMNCHAVRAVKPELGFFNFLFEFGKIAASKLCLQTPSNTTDWRSAARPALPVLSSLMMYT